MQTEQHHANLISFDTSVRIARGIDDVFAFVADPLELPRWNSAVRTVHGTAPRLGSTYAMRRELPTGGAVNQLEIFLLEPPTALGLRTTSGPTPFVYRYRFVADGAATAVELDATVDLGRAAALLAPLAARAVKRGVDANFATLKELLEHAPLA
jgi:uncharacterized protein YndB with AHSA1/START domain